MIALIVAHSKNNVIGNKGRIPWNIKGELRRYKELTTGNVVIMGRRSYEEIGKPLPNRMNIVLSTTKTYEGKNLITVRSLKEALDIAGDRDVYISGGEKIFEEAIHIVDKMYITLVDKVIEGDTYFPDFNEEDFIKQIDEHFHGDIPYTYMTYTRKEKK
ncbi:MAG: dihydrofolate reductase [Clostridium sp.]|uniref:dihydrofolate reductase n=1 Tax=Clostridium sp. TaxID=1506 RepID=UPI002A86D61C|nr:dihydrofolate reductase [Clostridium sp.]MDY5097442.1 dihydrofolate reductase [Clostridium sp.]